MHGVTRRRPRHRDAEAQGDMGVDDNTIVVFTTDNGTEVFTWPDGGQTLFAQSKGTMMECDFRVPAMIRWLGPAGVRASARRASCCHGRAGQLGRLEPMRHLSLGVAR